MLTHTHAVSSTVSVPKLHEGRDLKPIKRKWLPGTRRPKIGGEK